jgi:AcrR family transcriptional regulator
MRYSSEHKAATRKRLLESAGALVKKSGFGTTGVDALMAAAGLTAGAFYAHFKSKAELLDALIEQEMTRSLEMFQMDDAQRLASDLASYLSLGHVEHPERGCLLPALSAEIARADKTTREHFEQGLMQIKDRIAQQVPDEAQAWSLLAQAVGAVMLARAMRSRASRQGLLDGVRRSILRSLQHAHS